MKRFAILIIGTLGCTTHMDEKEIHTETQALTVAAGSGAGAAGATSPLPNSPEAVIKAYIDAYNKCDLATAKTLLAPEFVRFSNTTSTWEPMAVDEWSVMWTDFCKAFPDLRWTTQSFMASGDTVAVEVIEDATFTMPWRLPDGDYIRPTGQSYTSHNSVFFRVNSDGKIVNYRQYAGIAFLSVGLSITDLLRIQAAGF